MRIAFIAFSLAFATATASLADDFERGRFGDGSPQPQVLRHDRVDFTPTSSIGNSGPSGHLDDYSAGNGFGDRTLQPQVIHHNSDEHPSASLGLDVDEAYLDQDNAQNRFGDVSPAPQVLSN